MLTLRQKVLRLAREQHYLWKVRSVLGTPPVVPRDDGVVIFSMIGTRVLLPYLVAVKSLHRQLQRGRIAILDDGTLTAADKAILCEHCGDPEIFSAAAVDTRGCPTYSSWRRLFTLLELRRDNYVIQLDSDTVTIGAVQMVAQQIEAGKSFILRGEPGVAFADPAKVATQARANPEFDWVDRHVQLAIESVMEEVSVPGLERIRYARGCAGFAGFARDKRGSERAEAFSAEATRLIGFDKWSEWGSEQVASNFLIANELGSVLLPYERYCNFWNEPIGSDMRFVHFIGTYRYHGGVYAQLSREAIEHLRQDRRPADGSGQPAASV